MNYATRNFKPSIISRKFQERDGNDVAMSFIGLLQDNLYVPSCVVENVGTYKISQSGSPHAV